MEPQGIRIFDAISEGDVSILSLTLPDILNNIENGKNLYWSILYLYATGDLGSESKRYRKPPLTD